MTQSRHRANGLDGPPYIDFAGIEKGRPLAPDRVERRLAAILCADVVGYSRLMGDDEEATLRTLADYREIMRERIEAHAGRVVDAPCDALLAEFASPV